MKWLQLSFFPPRWKVTITVLLGSSHRERRIRSGAGTDVQTSSRRRPGAILGLDPDFHREPRIPAFALYPALAGRCRGFAGMTDHVEKRCLGFDGSRTHSPCSLLDCGLHDIIRVESLALNGLANGRVHAEEVSDPDDSF